MGRPLTRDIITAAAITTAALLAGCGISNPYAAGTTSTTTAAGSSTAVSASLPSSTATNPVPVHERNDTIPAAVAKANTTLAASAASTSQTAALATYTREYVNWTAKTVANVQKHLASISLDGARAEALQAAASYGADSILQTSQVSNSGSVVCIAHGQGSAAGKWVIVTREQTHGSGNYAGLPAGDHIYLAALTHTTAGWVISAWTPQS